MTNNQFSNLSIGFQNISGKHCPTLGCKLSNQIKFQNDIEILGETWSKCKKCSNVVEGYELIEFINPAKRANCKKGRDSGGLLVFAKNHISQSLKVLKKGDNRIWFEISDALFHDIPDKIKICAAYAPPENSHYLSTCFWEDFEEEMIALTNINSPTIIIGDLNARTGNLLDYVEVDGPQDEFISNIRPKPALRKNCDSVVNKFGKKTAHICSSFNLQIANGRFLGDQWGNFTHLNPNKGQSTVDYALISDSLFEHIEDFKVLPLNDYSDHSKIVINVKHAKIPDLTAEEEYPWADVEPGYKWDVDPAKFKAAFLSRKAKNLIEKCHEYLDAKLVAPTYDTIRELFCYAADESLEQKPIPKSPKSKKQKVLKKWFDTECFKLKEMVKKLANAKHRNPWDKSLIHRYKEIQKKYRKTCVSKRFNFLKDQAAKLENPDMCDFWEVWKNIGEEKSKSQTIPGVSGQQFEDYFKKLFKKQGGETPSTPLGGGLF